MQLQEKLVSSFVAFESEVDTMAPVHDVRTQALESFEKLGFPTKKMKNGNTPL
jgi:Fe-S cluster assembly protein SufD